jgi:hypothetical protein
LTNGGHTKRIRAYGLSLSEGCCWFCCEFPL